MKIKIALLSFSMLAIALLAGASQNVLAQEVPAPGGDDSFYLVSYFSNNVAAAPDATVSFVHDGSALLISQVPVQINLWADFYVFDDSEELTECCACLITPDGLLSESIRTELTANPLTGKVPPRGVIRSFVGDSRPDERYADGWAARMGDPYSGSDQERVLDHGDAIRRLESDRCGKKPVAESLLLRCAAERIALHLHAGRPRLLGLV